jgi:cation transport regulator ChaB
MGIIRDWAAYTNGAQGVPTKTTHELRSTLRNMYKDAFNQACGNQAEAEKKFAQSIDNDRRFDNYPTEKLIARFRDCYRSGAKLDFDHLEPSDHWRNPGTRG